MRARRSIVLAVVLVLALATGALADRAINRTFYSVTLADVNSLCFVRTGASSWNSVSNVGVRASDGQGYTATRTGSVGAGFKTQIENFITNNELGPLNTQERL